MLITGLVSISFRPLTPEQIAKLAAETGLDAVEWGGDVHVPPGDLATARRVAALTRDSGLSTAAYGSYYRLGEADDPKEAFAPVLEAACVLDTPVIRIWGGRQGSAELTDTQWDRLTDEGQVLTEMAAEAGKTLSLECHGGTLTDDYTASLRFLEAVPKMTMYWQPNQMRNKVYNQAAAVALAPYTTNIHVFHWDAVQRYPLSAGEAVWQTYLTAFSSGNHALLLEFMHDDRPESLTETVVVLRRIAANAVE